MSVHDKLLDLLQLVHLSLIVIVQLVLHLDEEVLFLFLLLLNLKVANLLFSSLSFLSYPSYPFDTARPS